MGKKEEINQKRIGLLLELAIINANLYRLTNQDQFNPQKVDTKAIKAQCLRNKVDLYKRKQMLEKESLDYTLSRQKSLS